MVQMTRSVPHFSEYKKMLSSTIVVDGAVEQMQQQMDEYIY